MNYKPLVLLVLLPSVVVCASAAEHYVRSDAAGTSMGTDWANAFTKLPSKLTRGDTYYLADGNYGSYTFADAVSGTTVIKVKKATAADHGTSTGWSPAYGDGEAVFSGTSSVWRFGPGVGYYEISGSVGALQGVPYGFRLTSTASRNSAEALVIADTSGTYNSTGGNEHIYFDHINFDWNNGTGSGSAGATRAIQWNTAKSNRGIHISNSYIHHSSGYGVYAASVSSDLLIDGAVFDSNGGAAQSHYETLWITGADNFVFRNSTIKDTKSGALTGWLMLGGVSNAQIYNNVFTCTNTSTCATGGNGIIATWDANQYANSNVNILNNTFANLPSSGNPAIYFFHSGGATDSNVVVKNNLVITKSFDVVGASVYTANSCGGGATCKGSSTENGVPSAIFKGWSTQDYRLTSHTAPGVVTTFASDQLGLVRETATWDRGAFQFGQSTNTATPPTNLVIQ